MIEKKISRRMFAKKMGFFAVGAGALCSMTACAKAEDAAMTNTSLPETEKDENAPLAQLHHVMVEYRDLDEAAHFWGDVMGFTLVARMLSPEDIMEEPNPDVLQMEVACFDSGSGALIECLHHISPEQIVLPYDQHGANDSATGVKEICLLVDDIDGWYEKIKAEGYEIILEIVETPNNRSFEMNDREGNSIQFWEYNVPSRENYWSSFDEPLGDVRTAEQIAFLKKTYK